jgi:hypothetical protein
MSQTETNAKSQFAQRVLKMNESHTWRKHFPAKQLEQARLAGPLNRMECMTLLSQLAMNIGSDAHMYAVQKLVATMEKAEELKQNYGGELPSKVDALYLELTEKYLALMEAIPQQFTIKLLEELEQPPATLGESLISKVHAWLNE